MAKPQVAHRLLSLGWTPGVTEQLLSNNKNPQNQVSVVYTLAVSKPMENKQNPQALMTVTNGLY